MSLFADLLYGPIFSDPYISTTLAFTLPDESEFQLAGIDRSSGVEVAASEIEVPQVRPAAVIRAGALAMAGYEHGELVGATLIMSGITWRIENTQPRPSPHGQSDGEIYLILIRA